MRSTKDIHKAFREYWQPLFTHVTENLFEDICNLELELPQYSLGQPEREYLINMGISNKDSLDRYELCFHEKSNEQSALCFKRSTNQETLSAVKVLKEGKAIGLDDIAPLFLIDPTGEGKLDTFIESLTFLFNIIFETSYYPLV